MCVDDEVICVIIVCYVSEYGEVFCLYIVIVVYVFDMLCVVGDCDDWMVVVIVYLVKFESVVELLIGCLVVVFVVFVVMLVCLVYVMLLLVMEVVLDELLWVLLGG